jgi:hypothetical protein
VRKLVFFLLVFGMAATATGEVSVRVCRADGNTPVPPVDPNFHVYPDIMVGTELTIIVYSDAAEVWDGALAIRGTDRDYGLLSGRDYNEIHSDYEGSHLPDAGPEAEVELWHDDIKEIDGFQLYTDFTEPNAGDWFIIDYNALAIGDCNVEFYDYSISYEDPNYYLEFSHVRTRDFNNDTKVDFIDFAVLASYWGDTVCSDPNWCEGVDLDTDGDIDIYDLALFTDFWLEKTR